MRRRFLVSLGPAAAFLAVAWMASSSVQAQAKKPYTPPKTSWGDPDLQGTYTNKAELGTPLERPKEFEGRELKDISAAELADILRRRQEKVVEDARPKPGQPEEPHAPIHWSDRYDILSASRPWLITDPGGMRPPLTEEGRKRNAAVAAARKGRGPMDDYSDFDYYDRCISRTLPGSMMPNILGNSYQIMQSPGLVVIRYEMVHESRIIPVDGRPHVGPAIRQLMGDPRGHFEGSTLVVETTNFTNGYVDGLGVGPNGQGQRRSEAFRLVERFTRIAPDRVEWSATIDDPIVWTRPWTFAMNLIQDEKEQIFEWACHEGNYGLMNMLSGARAQEKK